jgi:hypothetical protein
MWSGRLARELPFRNRTPPSPYLLESQVYRLFGPQNLEPQGDRGKVLISNNLEASLLWQQLSVGKLKYFRFLFE